MILIVTLSAVSFVILFLLVLCLCCSQRSPKPSALGRLDTQDASKTIYPSNLQYVSFDPNASPTLQTSIGNLRAELENRTPFRKVLREMGIQNKRLDGEFGDQSQKSDQEEYNTAHYLDKSKVLTTEDVA